MTYLGQSTGSTLCLKIGNRSIELLPFLRSIPIANENSRIYGSRSRLYLEVVIEANRKQYWSIARIGRLSNFQI